MDDQEKLERLRYAQIQCLTEDERERTFREYAGPFFLTAWEREDYEREQRGEKPQGPPR